MGEILNGLAGLIIPLIGSCNPHNPDFIDSKLRMIPEYSMPNYICRNEEASYRFYTTQFGTYNVFEVNPKEGKTLRFTGYLPIDRIKHFQVGGHLSKNYKYSELTEEAREEILKLYKYHLRNFHNCKRDKELNEIREASNISFDR